RAPALRRDANVNTRVSREPLVAAPAAAPGSGTTAGACGAAASGAAAARRLDVLRNLLATLHRLGAPLFLGARTGEQVGHRVVPLVAPVLVVAVVLFA